MSRPGDGQRRRAGSDAGSISGSDAGSDDASDADSISEGSG